MSKQPYELVQSDYEKIQDVILRLSYGVSLVINVELASKSSDNKRFHYHKEYMYTSSKYINKDRVVNIKRDINVYLTFEKKNHDNVMIRLMDMYFANENLQCCLEWFNPSGDLFKKIFKLDRNKKLTLASEGFVTIGPLALAKYIEISPTVIVYDNGDRVEGVHMNFNNDFHMDTTINTFMALVYIFNTINLVDCAQNMLNYLQRPSLGTNLTEFKNGMAYESEYAEGKEGRNINIKKKQRSFFDKMNGL